MGKSWQPPVRFYVAGRQTINSRDYRCECRDRRPTTRRLLIKRTISGSGVIYTSQERQELPEGCIFMIQRPGPYLYCYEGDGEPWNFEYVSLILPNTGDWLPPRIQRQPAWDASANSELFSQMTQMVNRVMNNRRRQSVNGNEASLGNDSIRDSAAAYQLYLSCLASRMQPQQNIAPAAARLREYLSRNFRQTLQLSQICSEIGYTPEALSRLFKKAYSMPPLQYLINLRLDCARQMLQQPDCQLKYIAHECGFDSLNYFCRVFRKYYGISPGKYRRNPDPLRLFS